MKYYDEKLYDLQQQVSMKAHLRAKLNDLRRQKAKLEEKTAHLLLISQNEQADVERLEGHNLAALFYRLAGKKDEMLDKEREEAYAAAAKYDAAARELSAVDEDIISYATQLRSLDGCEERYEQLLNEKAEVLKTSGTADGDKILKAQQQLALLKNQIKELNEAVTAGNKALSIANSVLARLDEAESWGTWDLLGGGLVSDIAKHNKLDEAQSLVEQLQVQLRRFKTELADVAVCEDISVRIDGFLRFADYFFDGLFADWAVLDRIDGSKKQVEKTKGQITDVLNTLSAMLSSAELEHSNLKKESDELILKADLL